MYPTSPHNVKALTMNLLNIAYRCGSEITQEDYVVQSNSLHQQRKL